MLCNKTLHWYCVDCAITLFWKWFKVLAQLRQDNFRFWDSWRLSPVVAAAEAAKVGAFCMWNPLFWALVLFWLTVSDPHFCLPHGHCTSAPLVIPIDSSLQFSLFLSIWHKPSQENPVKQTTDQKKLMQLTCLQSSHCLFCMHVIHISP